MVQSLSAAKRRLAFVIWNFEITEWEPFTALVDRVSKQGFSTVRLHLSWFNAETTPGVYDFAPYDKQIEYIRSRGMDAAVSTALRAFLKVKTPVKPMYQPSFTSCRAISAEPE